MTSVPAHPTSVKQRHGSTDPRKVEIWKPVPDWPAYEVSSFGRVKSFWIRIRKKGGGGFFHVIGGRGKILKPSPNRKGYLRVVFCDNAGGRKTKLIHQLVLETFVGPCPPGMECRHHPDTTRSNNRLSNLGWGTPSQNTIDAVLAGTLNAVRLTRADVERIWPRLVAGERHNSIALDFQVGDRAISSIAQRKTWVHVTKNLPGEPSDFFLTAAVVTDIWGRLVQGESAGDIARSLGVAPGTIYKVRNGETHAEVTSKLPGTPGRHARWRLRDDDIPTIWERIVKGESLTAIGADFGVGKGLIWQIKNKLCYRRITDGLPGIPAPRS